MVARYDQDTQDLSLLAYDQYMRFIHWTPRLTTHDMGVLLQRIRAGKAEQSKQVQDRQVVDDAKQARDQLVTGLQRVVLHMARRCLSRSSGMELLDLVQEGNIGLLKAIELHQADRDNEFLGFASIYIRYALWQALVDKNQLIRLPENIVRPLKQLHRAENRLLSVLGREPSLEEVAEEAGLSAAVVAEVLTSESRCSTVESLQGLLFEEDAEDRHDFVSLFTEVSAVDQARQATLEQAVQQAIATLPRRQQRVISLRYGLDGQELNNPDTATALGTTLKAVEAVGCRARGRLRGLLAPLYESRHDEEVA